jgi:hypothetical protein
MASGAKQNRMAPEAQTLFSMTLFLALSSLMAWLKRRNQASLQSGGAMPVLPEPNR